MAPGPRVSSDDITPAAGTARSRTHPPRLAAARDGIRPRSSAYVTFPATAERPAVPV